ncbi:MAG: VOC family protein [Chloroflexi bacterium]|nr:VOC family protein [Chloroflexota bacterium]
MPASPIVHVESPAKDYVAADKFYADVFGWKIEVQSQFNYHMFAIEGGPGGGFVEADGKDNRVGEVLIYLGVPDIVAALKKVESAGGKTVTGKTEIPGNGWFAFFTDPTGNRIGLYERIP